MKEIIRQVISMERVNSDGRTVTFTQVAGSMTKKKALGFSRAKMELNTTANIQKINRMAPESTHGPTNMSTTVSGITARKQAKVFSLRTTAMFTMGSGGKIKRAVWVHSPRKINLHTKANGMKTINTATESSPSLTESSSRAIGLTTSQMGPAGYNLRKEWSAGY